MVRGKGRGRSRSQSTRDQNSTSSRDQQTNSTNPTTVVPTTEKSKKSSPYNRDFELHLTEHGIHNVLRSNKPDLTEVLAASAEPRPSLSPSKFSDGAFERFQDNQDDAKDEDDVIANVLPTLLGSSAGHTTRKTSTSARNTMFGNLAPMTDGTLVVPKPDIYYGARPEQLTRSVRDELADRIVPSTMQDKPMAPNFFLEVKGPMGTPAVVSRQARYDGAVGARGMHALQNYDPGAGIEPQYDEKPRTLTATYQSGTLNLYSHHVTEPTIEEMPHAYHMKRVNGWYVTGDKETFIRGATALRNTMDLAGQYRDQFIDTANARAASYVQQRRDESPDELALSPAMDMTSEMQDQEVSYDKDPILDSILDPTQTQVQTREDSPDELALPASTPAQTWQAAAASSPSTRQKRHHRMLSDNATTTTNANSPAPAKSRSRRRQPGRYGGGHASSSAVAPSPAKVLATTPDPYEVATYWKHGKICFLNTQGKEVRTEKKTWKEHAYADGTAWFSWQRSGSPRMYWTLYLAAGR